MAKSVIFPRSSLRFILRPKYYSHLRLFTEAGLAAAVRSRHRLRHLHTGLSSRTQAERRKEPSIGKNERDEQASKRKPPRSPAANASLRRSAYEAERPGIRVNDGAYARGILSARQEEQTKTVTAFCAAEEYHIERVARTLRDAGYTLDPFHTDLYPQVIHFQMPSTKDSDSTNRNSRQSTSSLGDIFIFPLGTVVAWNVDEERVRHLIAGALRDAALNPHLGKPETEDLDYLEDPSSEKSIVVGDTIRIGTKSLASIATRSTTEEGRDQTGAINEQFRGSPGPEESQHLAPRKQCLHSQNITLARIAFSSGLARSTKIAFLESLLDNYFGNTQRIPQLLSTGSRLPYNRAFMLRKTGELLYIRAQLNMTELTDRLPDLFWDSRHELGLEGYFEQVGRALDVGVRIKTLNERMDYAQEIAAVLRENLSERHGLLLEWLIISLIAVEVCVEGWKVWKELKASGDPNSSENLIHRWLLKELEQQVNKVE